MRENRHEKIQVRINRMELALLDRLCDMSGTKYAELVRELIRQEAELRGILKSTIKEYQIWPEEE